MLPITLMFLTTLIYSFFPLAASLGIEHSTPIYFVFLATLYGVGISLGFLLLSVSLRKVLSLPKDLFKLPGRTIWAAVLSGTTANLGNVLFILALGMMSKAGATIIMESWPILAMIMAPAIIDKTWRDLTFYHAIFGFMGFFGVALISIADQGMTLSSFMRNPGALFEGADIVSYAGVLCAFMGSFCFAISGVFRAQFLNKLPKNFQDTYDGSEGQIRLTVIAEAFSKLFYVPVIVLALMFMEPSAVNNTPLVAQVHFSAFLMALIIVLVNALYSYVLHKTDNAAVNLIWFFAPLLAVFWLAMFGVTQMTLLIALGGVVIIVANLCVTWLDHKKPPAIAP